VDSVHHSWTVGGVGSWWTEDRAMVGSSPEHLLIASTGHGRSPWVRGKREEIVGILTACTNRRRDN
jgi:hypothetical protein